MLVTPNVNLRQALLAPRSVVLVGQSNDAGKTAGRPLKYLRQAGFAGTIYCVNARRDTVLGELLRMDNLTLGYTFAGLRNVQDARIFGTIQNVFTTTKYSGVDPTAGVNGIDNNLYPRSRTFLAGLSVGF